MATWIVESSWSHFRRRRCLHIAGPLEVFSVASFLDPDAVYRTSLVSVTGGLVLMSSGVELATDVISEVRGADRHAGRGRRPRQAGCRRGRSAARSGSPFGGMQPSCDVGVHRCIRARRGRVAGRSASDDALALVPRSSPRCTRDLRVDANAIYVRDWLACGRRRASLRASTSPALVADDHGQQLRPGSPGVRRATFDVPAGRRSSRRRLPRRSPSASRLRELLDWIVQHPDGGPVGCRVCRGVCICRIATSARVFNVRTRCHPGRTCRGGSGGRSATAARDDDGARRSGCATRRLLVRLRRCSGRSGVGSAPHPPPTGSIRQVRDTGLMS